MLSCGAMVHLAVLCHLCPPPDISHAIYLVLSERVLLPLYRPIYSTIRLYQMAWEHHFTAPMIDHPGPNMWLFVHPTIGSLKLNADGPSSSLNWLTQMCLRRYCNSLHLYRQVHRPLTEFKLLLLLSETPCHMLSQIYISPFYLIPITHTLPT